VGPSCGPQLFREIRQATWLAFSDHVLGRYLLMPVGNTQNSTTNLLMYFLIAKCIILEVMNAFYGLDPPI